MKPPSNMTAIINRKRYSVATATLLAHDSYWDGSNMERHGRNTYLYRTPSGRYFTLHLTMWQGETDTIVPRELAEAADLFEDLHEQEVTFEEAFPSIPLEDA